MHACALRQQILAELQLSIGGSHCQRNTSEPADIRTSQHTAPVPIHRYFSIRNDRSNDHAEQGDEVAGREWGRGVGGGNGGGVSHAVCGIAGSAGGR